MTLATAGFAIKTKVTRRAQFLAEMDKVVPWPRLLAVIEPHYPVAEQGRPRGIATRGDIRSDEARLSTPT
jgi:IS5 family transposase